MAYYLDLFSPETYEAFSRSNKEISGFRERQENAARRVHVGDKLICYMTKLSRWVGILEVTSEYFKDNSPIFYESNDPFVIRFHVKPNVWLPKEKAFPIKDDQSWNQLSFTRDYDKNSSYWTGRFRNSLNPISEVDGKIIENLLVSQTNGGLTFKVNENDYVRYATPRIHNEKTISVTVPQDIKSEEKPVNDIEQREVRESIKIQALIANIGIQMGMKIWIPRNDRASVLTELHGIGVSILESLPFNYSEATLKTIEQIDVLWIKNRSIVRAFEVEHTTSIYSGILRMADLLALQPNIDIKLHIVAPGSRRDKVFQELQRPVFSIFERGPLSESCTYLSYESVIELSKEKHLTYMSDSVLDDYSESAD